MKRAALVAALVACALLTMGIAPADGLKVHLEGDTLHITAPKLSFLSGKALERLKDGVSVAFVGQLTVTTEPNALVSDARSSARFALSYDIWEQRFSVSRFGDKPGARRTISHLSAQAAEAWCLDNLTLERAQLPPDKAFYVHLDLRADDPKDQLDVVGEGGINITRLIQVFSQPVKGKQQQQWLRQAGPFRLAELRKASRF